MRKKKKILLSYTIIFLVISLISCKNTGTTEDKFPLEGLVNVEASRETAPVQDDDDAADDPALWVHPDDPAKSLIIGTNKQRGLVVYDLEGKEVFAYDCGRVNNVDIRQDFPLGGELVDIAAASNRSGNIITIVRIMPSGELVNISSRTIQSGHGEVYGFCLYHDIHSDKFYAFINGKDGGVEQWLLFDDGNGRIDATIVRTFALGSQPEGCVADDELGYLYIGEEKQGIWKFMASPDLGDEAIMVDSVSSPYLEEDIEGLAIYYAPGGKGYLIASSQGNNTFAVYERDSNNRYLGSFTIIDGTIDGVQETDGIEVSGASLGPEFPHGVFIAQDGFNKDGDMAVNQNFKLVPWEAIAKSFQPAL